MISPSPLKGRVALVTGGAVRLGRAFAEGLAERGASVVVHYGRSQPEALELLARLKEKRRRAAVVRADLSREDEAALLLERAGRALGPVDILVNSAAIFEAGGIRETSPEAFDRHLAINLKAPYLLSRAFAAAGRPGRIVNIADWRALRPGVEHFAYTVSKAGLIAMTRSLAAALAPRIQVNALALGAILPPPKMGREEQARLIGRVPARRFGTAAEAVRALLFLVEGPEYVTGEVLHVDGGRHLV